MWKNILIVIGLLLLARNILILLEQQRLINEKELEIQEGEANFDQNDGLGIHKMKN